MFKRNYFKANLMTHQPYLWATPFRPAQNRGSIMLLVVVSMLLLAIIGAAFLQVTRRDQNAVNQVTSNNIDIVARNLTSYISEVLKRDLLNDAETIMFDGITDEPYDYPWTNAAANADGDSVMGFEVLNQNGGAFPDRDGDTFSDQAHGGLLDDTWLASTEPDFTGAASLWFWPHITNLNGIFLTLPELGSTNKTPLEEPVNNGAVTDSTYKWRYDSNLLLTAPTDSTAIDFKQTGYDTVGVDADGDGILDSKWTWAPIRQISGISYVMAVRIIDNSSMVNANSALSQVSAMDTFHATVEAPSWYNTSELDFGNFYYGYTSSNTELLSHLNYLINPGTALTSSLVPFSTRDNFWQYGPYLYGNYNSGNSPASNFQKYGINEELYLRHRNGLNNTSISSTLGTLMPTWLRSATNETVYTDTGNATVFDYFTNDPRHLITVKSGNAVYAAGVAGATGYKLKKDINKLITSGTTALAQSIFDVYSVAGSTPDLPTGLTTATKLSTQAAVNIIDYADADNQLTPYDSSALTNTRFGMEALPAITEVYVQRPYLINGTANIIPLTTWSANTDANIATRTIGYAIEIRNPFRKPILLTDVYLYVNGTQFTNSDTKGDLAALTGLTTLAVDGTVILYQNSAGGDATNDNVTNQIDITETPTPTLKSITDTWPWASGTGEEAITVELRATVADDLIAVDAGTDPDILTWGYQEVPSVTWSAIEGPLAWSNVHAATDPDTSYIYRQHNTVGNGDGLNSLLVGVVPIPWTSYIDQNPTSTNTVLYHLNSNLIIPRLGLKDKTISQTWDTVFTFNGGSNSVIDTTSHQVLISDSGAIDQIGELMQITMVGLKTTTALPYTTTFSKNWNAQSNADNYRLSLTSTIANAVGTGNLAIPHAYYLMDQYVTQSPNEDNLDNDGDGTNDNTTELFIPGTININTAPSQLLNAILPVPDTTVRSNLVTEILNYRDMSGSYTASTSRANRGNKGIAFMGELLGMTASTTTGTQQYGTDGIDTITSGTNNTVIDFISNPPALGTADGVKDDREEQLILANQLMGVVSTRSDIFTAYILIQGYPSNNFTKGAVETKRVIAVFDRSNIVNGSSTPKLLGVYEY